MTCNLNTKIKWITKKIVLVFKKNFYIENTYKQFKNKSEKKESFYGLIFCLQKLKHDYRPFEKEKIYRHFLFRHYY